MHLPGCPDSSIICFPYLGLSCSIPEPTLHYNKIQTLAPLLTKSCVARYRPLGEKRVCTTDDILWLTQETLASFPSHHWDVCPGRWEVFGLSRVVQVAERLQAVLRLWLKGNRRNGRCYVMSFWKMNGIQLELHSKRCRSNLGSIFTNNFTDPDGEE